MSRDVWCTLPSELALQIAQHNADDRETLRAMCLVSKAMRSVAVEPLFSVLHFAEDKDFVKWWEILQRTPGLGAAVHKVKISASGEPYLLKTLPSVVEVEWMDTMNLWRADIAVDYHKRIFPNATRLSFVNISFRDPSKLITVLRACRPLKSLSIVGSDFRVGTETETEPFMPSVDLSALEELTFAHNGTYHDQHGVFVTLLQASPPARLQTLNLGLGHRRRFSDPCSVATMRTALSLASSTLTRLSIDPIFHTSPADETFDTAIKRLPTLSALELLNIWLAPPGTSNSQVVTFLQALNTLPVVTVLRLYVDLTGEDEDYEPNHSELFSAQPAVFQRGSIDKCFPNLREVVFSFYGPRSSALYDASVGREYRGKLQAGLTAQLAESSAGVEDLVRIEWLDDKYREVNLGGALPTPAEQGLRKGARRSIIDKLSAKFHLHK